jgi:hypothetical protein
MDVIDPSCPQPQRILVLQTNQFRVAGIVGVMGVPALFFKWISIFITVGGYL